MASNIPVIVQGNSFSLAIPLQIYIIDEGEMVLQDYTPDPTDEVSVQLKGSRRNYTYTPTIDGNVAYIDLSGNELADNYSVVVSIVKANGQRLRSFRTDQFFIVESSDDLTQDDIIAGLEENVIYLNAQAFIAGADGRGIESIVKTATAGLVDTYTITYSDNTTSTFNVTNGANGQAGAQGADGVGITSIEKTATVGLVDTYTITLSNGQTSTFYVTNGKDGVDLGLATIVNNLTEGGEESVLSAEMGKELREAFDALVDSLGDYAFVNGKPTLPWNVPDYVEIEFLQSNGNQYIDTGIVGNLNTRIEIKASASAVPAWFCGSRGNNTNDITVYASTNATCRFGNKSVKHDFSANTLYEVSFAKDSLVVNGESKAIGASTAFTTPNNICIMWCGTSFSGGTKVYSFKLYDGNDLLRDMIPVRVGQVGYMYDRVSGLLFGNAGSGSFVLGNDKN